MNKPSIRFSPYEMRIVELLSDGLPHTKNEIREILNGVEKVRSRFNGTPVTDESIQVMISVIRQRLRTLGPLTISLVPEALSLNGVVCWQLMKYLPASRDELHKHYALADDP